jgi:hypothetical protein
MTGLHVIENAITSRTVQSVGGFLPIRIKVKNAETGATVEMELENENTVDEVIESAATFWSKDMGAYVLRKGKKVLRGGNTLQDTGIRADDVLELIPDPEGG